MLRELRGRGCKPVPRIGERLNSWLESRLKRKVHPEEAREMSLQWYPRIIHTHTLSTHFLFNASWAMLRDKCNCIIDRLWGSGTKGILLQRKTRESQEGNRNWNFHFFFVWIGLDGDVGDLSQFRRIYNVSATLGKPWIDGSASVNKISVAVRAN